VRYGWVAIVLLFAVPAVGDQSATRIRFHVTKLSSAAVSDEHSSGTKYTVEGYDVETETTYRGECKDIVFFDNQGKASMHNVCIVPQAAKEYSVKVFPTSFMFPCDTPDGECPSGDPNVTRYMYLAYTITDEEEKPRHKPTRVRWSTGPSVLVLGFAATSSRAKRDLHLSPLVLRTNINGTPCTFVADMPVHTRTNPAIASFIFGLLYGLVQVPSLYFQQLTPP
jgi:hypothetical protein